MYRHIYMYIPVFSVPRTSMSNSSRQNNEATITVSLHKAMKKLLYQAVFQLQQFHCYLPNKNTLTEN